MNYHIPTAYVILHGAHLEWVVLDDQIAAQNMMELIMQKYWKRNLSHGGMTFDEFKYMTHHQFIIKQAQYGEYPE